MTIWELQNSINVLDRQQFVKRIKFEFIPKIEERLKKLNGNWQQSKWSGNEEEAKLAKFEHEIETKFLIKLKTKLSNYDIYNQQMKRVCRICGEIECACYALEEDKNFKEQINKLL